MAELWGGAPARSTKDTLDIEAGRRINATCPDCRGPLSEFSYDELYEFRCLVGHSYSPRAVLAAPHLPAAVAERLKVQTEQKVRRGLSRSMS